MKENDNNKLKKTIIFNIKNNNTDEIYKLKSYNNMYAIQNKETHKKSNHDLEKYYHYINILINEKKIDKETFEFIKNNQKLKQYLTEEKNLINLRNYLIHNSNTTNHNIEKIENSDNKSFENFIKSRVSNKMSKGQFAFNLNYYSERNGISPSDMAKRLETSISTVSDWYNGVNFPRPDKIRALASELNIPVSILIEEEHNINSSLFNTYTDNNTYNTLQNHKHIPFGITTENIEYIEKWNNINKEWLKNSNEYFALKMNDDSMYPKFQKDDVIIFQKTNIFPSNNKNCAILINETDIDFKKIIQTEAGLILQPINDKEFEPTFFSNKEIMKNNIKILGIPKEIRRQID